MAKINNTNTHRFMVIVNTMGVYVLIVLLLIAGFIIRPQDFFSAANWRSILQACALLGMVTAGMAFVTYSANYADMSTPIQIAFAGMVSVQFLALGFWPAAFLGVLSGVLLGCVNGLMIGKLRANPIIWTMAFNFVMSGICRWLWQGKQIYPDMIPGVPLSAVDTFNAISRSNFLHIPISIIVMVILFIICGFIFARTRFGNQLKIVGSNYEVARLSGINVVRSIVGVYIINGICCAIAGIFLASMQKTGAYYAGDGYDFRAVTSVLLGGVTLAGGRGNMVGVFGGVITIGLLTNIMNLLGVPSFNQWLVQGLVFLFIVWLTTNTSRKLGKE